MTDKSPELMKALSQIRLGNSKRDLSHKNQDSIACIVTASSYSLDLSLVLEVGNGDFKDGFKFIRDKLGQDAEILYRDDLNE